MVQFVRFVVCMRGLVRLTTEFDEAFAWQSLAIRANDANAVIAQLRLGHVVRQPTLHATSFTATAIVLSGVFCVAVATYSARIQAKEAAFPRLDDGALLDQPAAHANCYKV
jgi:hypothetical protein